MTSQRKGRIAMVRMPLRSSFAMNLKTALGMAVIAAASVACGSGLAQEETAIAPTRVLSFGSRETGGGVERQTLEVMVERATDRGREIQFTKHSDQVVVSRGSYNSTTTSATWDESGETIKYKTSPHQRRTVTIDIEGTRVGHFNEGIGSPTSDKIPTEMADPIIIQEDSMGCWQLLFDRWMQRRADNPPTDANGQPLHPLAQLEFQAIEPTALRVNRYNFVVAGEEPAMLNGRKVPTTRIEVTRSDPGQQLNAMIMTWSFWLDGEGTMVRMLKRTQPGAPQEVESYNLAFKPRFAGTITRVVDIAVGDEGSGNVRQCQYSTNDLSSLLKTSAKAMPGVMIVDDSPDTEEGLAQRTALEIARTGIRTLVVREGTDVTQEVAALKQAWQKFVTLEGVDAERCYLLTIGESVRRGAELAQELQMAGWVVVNGKLLEGVTLARPEMPILVTYGDTANNSATGDMEISSRARCAEALESGATAGQVRVAVLPQVNGSMKLVKGDAPPEPTLAVGYLRTLSRWFRDQWK